MRLQSDTTLYVGTPTPLGFMNRPNSAGLFMLKEGEPRGGYSMVKADTPSDFTRKVMVDSVRKQLVLSQEYMPVTDISSALLRIVKTEVPVYPDDEYLYLRALPQGKGLYEIHSEINCEVSCEERMLTKNFYDYAVFTKEGESVLRAGSYLPTDFYLWLDTARGPGSNRFRTSIYIVQGAPDTANFEVQGYFLHVSDSTRLNDDDYSVLIPETGKRYIRADFVHAKRTAPNTLQLSDTKSAGEGTGINEYRFYMQETEEDAKYYLVTEKGYGGHRDSTGYLSYSRASGKYYFGPREGTNKLTVELKKSNGPVANEVISKPSAPQVTRKEITVTGETGKMTVQNAAGCRVQVYNIVGQIIADEIAASDRETIPVSRGIAIVKIGRSVTKKVVVK
jgi:hypothetical protein